MQQVATQLKATSPRLSLAFRRDVEGLRALAIVLVVLSHAGLPFLNGGFIGVDVFFVLSGYLITELLLQEVKGTGRIDFPRFYARRARRLLPAAMVLLLAVSLAEAAVVSPLAQFQVLKAALAALFYSSNLLFVHLDLHYFARGQAPNPLLHTWSLAVEEQFYIVWPILLLLLTRLAKTRRRVATVLGVIAVVSFVYCVWLTARNPAGAFFLLPARVWEFCAGGLLAHASTAWLGRHAKLTSGLGIAGLVALLCCGQFMSEAAFPGAVAVLPVLATMALLATGKAMPSSLAPRLLSSRAAVFCGGLSYSIYLWHWPALVIAQQLFPTIGVAGRLLAIGAAVLLAAIVHRTVENPIRYNAFLASRSKLTLALAAIGALICVGGLAGWRFALSRSQQFNRFEQALNDLPALYSQGCNIPLTDPRPRACVFGETAHPQSTVVLYGDSHAAEWFPAINQIALSLHWKLITLVKPHCTGLNLAEDVSPLMEQVCAQWRSQAIRQIQRLHPDIVFVSSASIHPGRNGQMVTDPGTWKEATRITLTALAEHDTQVRFIRDTPHAGYNVLECLAQSEWDGRTRCPVIDPANALYPEIFAAEQRAAAGLDSVRFLDLTDLLCGQSECSPVIAGMIVYRDADHLTATFNRSLAGNLFDRLSK